MSYALRNTLILLFFLLLILGSGYVYLTFFQASQFGELNEQIENKERELEEMRNTANLLPMLQERFLEASVFIENFDKSLFKNNNPDGVFRFLTSLNNLNTVEFNYIFIDSTSTDQYGIISSDVSGIGSYQNVIRFINRIENSGPVQKLNDVTITPVLQVGSYQNVNFSFNIESYYDRANLFEENKTDEIALGPVLSNHNPFFPGIRNVQPNEDNLVNVESSRLIGVGGNQVFISDQNGSVITLRVRDRVYLGFLEEINTLERKATFFLNKGGIVERITLEVQP